MACLCVYDVLKNWPSECLLIEEKAVIGKQRNSYKFKITILQKLETVIRFECRSLQVLSRTSATKGTNETAEVRPCLAVSAITLFCT